MTPDTPDELPGLLREAQDRGLRTAAEQLLITFRRTCGQAMNWHRMAGRVLAEEGLDTDVLRQGIEAWIARGRAELREGLRHLLEEPAE